MKIRCVGIVFCLCALPATAGSSDSFLSLLDKIQETRGVPFTHPDVDRDGVTNIHDNDDDGDGVIDSLDSAPLDPNITSRIDIKPWVNEIRVSESAVVVEIAKWSTNSCEEIYVTVFDQYGELVLGPPSVNHPGKGVRLDNAHNNYRGGVKCEHSKANGYGFVDAIFSEDFQGIDPTLIRGVFLERSAQCLEVLSFDESITPVAGQCAGVEPAVVSVVDLPNGTSLARSGVGSTREDFDA